MDVNNINMVFRALIALSTSTQHIVLPWHAKLIKKASEMVESIIVLQDEYIDQCCFSLPRCSVSFPRVCLLGTYSIRGDIWLVVYML